MSRRMPDPAGLIAGIAFTGIGLAFLVGEVELANRARWVWPIILLSLGAGILAAVLRRPADQPASAADTAAASSTASAAGTGALATETPPATGTLPAPEQRSDTAVWPDDQATAAPLATDSGPAPQERSDTAVLPDDEATKTRPPAAAWPAEEERSDAAAALPEADAQPGVEEERDHGLGADTDERPGDQEREPAASLEVGEDAEEDRRRQAGGPPA
jgi:hypothetical protein